MKKVFALALTLVLSISIATAALAASIDFSSKAVVGICPFGAGGGTDLVMRGIADAASGYFKNFTVENHTGAGGATGHLYGANAVPDGTVITMICADMLTLEAMGNNAGLTYSMFKPIMMVNSAYAAISVKADDTRFNTIKDLVKYSKQNNVNVGNSGIGAMWHLAAAGLEDAAKAKFRHIGYDGGAAAEITDLLGGHVDAICTSFAEVSSYYQSGELKVLAVMAPERLKAAPDIPTCRESEYDAVIGTWRGLGVPSATPDDVVEELYKIFDKVCASEKFVQFMANRNEVIEVRNGANFTEMMAEQLGLFKALVDKLGIKVN